MTLRVVHLPARDGRTGLDGFEGSPLDPRYTFQSFVVGAPNRLAHAAGLQVAESAGDQPLKYNPLYLHARVGMGKTHLLHAIAWEVKQRNANAKVLYLTAERFMYSFADALQTRDAPAFKEKLRTIDLLLIDDMEFLQGAPFSRSSATRSIRLSMAASKSSSPPIARLCCLKASTRGCAHGFPAVSSPRCLPSTMICA